jgi:hypothetical protein
MTSGSTSTRNFNADSTRRRCVIFLFIWRLTHHVDAENWAMNSFFTSVEWSYGDVIVLLHIMQSRYEKRYLLPAGSLNQTLHHQFHIVFYLHQW